MKGLNYGNQIWLGVIQLVICHILAHLLEMGWIINIGWIIYGLLFVLHPVYPQRAASSPHIKLYVRIAGVVIVLFGLMLRNHIGEDYISETLGVNAKPGAVLSSYNDHGGFHGDGTTFEVRIYSDDSLLTEIQQHSDWKPLPLTENLEIIAYGKEYPGFSIGPYIFVRGYAEFPIVEEGYYYFYDRQSDSTDDADVLNRGSYNITLAIYDLNSRTLYYCDYDT